MNLWPQYILAVPGKGSAHYRVWGHLGLCCVCFCTSVLPCRTSHLNVLPVNLEDSEDDLRDLCVGSCTFLTLCSPYVLHLEA